MKNVFALALVVFSMASSLSVSANLIINGSFEDNEVNAKKWRWFYAQDVKGWDGSPIEIWHKLGGLEAADGNQLTELNSVTKGNSDFSISQSFAAMNGNLYNLSFAYRARENDDEMFKVTLLDEDGRAFFEQVIDDHKTGRWHTFNRRFTAISDFVTLRFLSLNTGTMGNLIDNIAVTAAPRFSALQAQQVSAPNLVTALFIALGGIFFINRRRHKQD